MILWLLVLVIVVVSASVETFHLMERHKPRASFVNLRASEQSETHQLVFAIKQRNIDVLDTKLLEISTPGSPTYQRWMTFEEVGELVSNDESASMLLNWLKDNNIDVQSTTVRSEYIKATASIGTWEKLLNTKFYLYEDRSLKSAMKKSQRTMHRAHEYSLPAHLVPHVAAVFNTVQTPPEFHRNYRLSGARSNERKTNLRISPVSEEEARSPRRLQQQGLVTVQFLNRFYEITTNAGSPSMSQSVFETNEQSFSQADLKQFQQLYSLPVQPALAPYGFNVTSSACDFETCGEGNLDLQYIMGVAQHTATIYWYVSENGDTDPFVAWVTDIANTTNPPLVNSMSWGAEEQLAAPDLEDAFNIEAMKLAAMGVTVLVSSGDNGAAGDPTMCNTASGSADAGYWSGTPYSGSGYFPSFPATSPYVTAVGATQGPNNGDPEIVCQAQLGGVITSGGGFSTYFPRPSWQNNVVSHYLSTVSPQPTAGYNPNGRAYPDVSMIGVWYQVIIGGAMQNVFGTSASAPMFAAMVTLVNTARASEGKPSVGFLNPTLYNHTYNNPFFNDIKSGHNKCTSGSNPSSVVCCSSGFTATEGWDPATGFGSVNYTQLLNMFNPPEPTAQPSAEPTAEPTVRPTSPTVLPTAGPTNPTVAPSRAPTRGPTIAPSGSRAPSRAPTPPPSPIIMFTTNVTLSGLTSPVLDTAARNAFLLTLATIMKVPLAALHYRGSSIISTQRRLAEEKVFNYLTGGLHELKDVIGQQIHLEATYTVNTVTDVNVVLDQTDYNTADDLYDGATGALTNSISGTTFDDTLHNNANTYGSGNMAGADGTGASYSTPTVVQGTNPTNGDTEDDDAEETLSDGAIAGIVIGAFVALVLILTCCYCTFCHHADNSTAIQRSNNRT